MSGLDKIKTNLYVYQAAIAASPAAAATSNATITVTDTTNRGLAIYVSSVSFGHPEHYFLTVWTPKILGQDLLMMTILEDSACSVTPTIQTKQLLA